MHLAIASCAGADFFVTCDDKLLRKSCPISGLKCHVVPPFGIVAEVLKVTVRINAISEINQRANDALIGDLGVVDTIRFLNQFRAGSGDYTAEREHLFEDMTARDIIAEIKSRWNNGSDSFS